MSKNQSTIGHEAFLTNNRKRLVIKYNKQTFEYQDETIHLGPWSLDCLLFSTLHQGVIMFRRGEFIPLGKISSMPIWTESGDLLYLNFNVIHMLYTDQKDYNLVRMNPNDLTVVAWKKIHFEELIGQAIPSSDETYLAYSDKRGTFVIEVETGTIVGSMLSQGTFFWTTPYDLVFYNEDNVIVYNVPNREFLLKYTWQANEIVNFGHLIIISSKYRFIHDLKSEITHSTIFPRDKYYFRLEGNIIITSNKEIILELE